MVSQLKKLKYSMKLKILVFFSLLFFFTQLLFSIYLAVKKSQREASLLVERSGKGKELQKEVPEKNIEAANLESSLMGHWKSLFQHMDHIFQREADQLVSLLTVLLSL